MRASTPNAQVRIGTRPLWRIRLAREWPRYLLSALAVAGLAASARFAIDPPRPADAEGGRIRPRAAGPRRRGLRGAVRAQLPDLERGRTAGP